MSTSAPSHHRSSSDSFESLSQFSQRRNKVKLFFTLNDHSGHIQPTLFKVTKGLAKTSLVLEGEPNPAFITGIYGKIILTLVESSVNVSLDLNHKALNGATRPFEFSSGVYDLTITDFDKEIFSNVGDQTSFSLKLCSTDEKVRSTIPTSIKIFNPEGGLLTS